MNNVRIAALLSLAFVLAVPKQASAAGFWLTDRGARALGRGGAFTAGADDGQSLWYNPAGLAYTGRNHVLADYTLTLFRGSFQRVTRDDVNGQPPKVAVDPLLLPVPSFALADNFGMKDFHFGTGVSAPNGITLRWPEFAGVTADGMRRPGPTRHSLVSMSGTLLADIAVGAAYSGIKGLSIGAALHVIPARFSLGSYISACDYGALCQQPEQADYEAPANINLKMAVAFTPQVGLIYQQKKFRIGASVTMFYNIKGDADFKTALPNAPLFGPSDECTSAGARESNPKCARVVGDKAGLNIKMPMVARFGIEIRPTKAWRVEAGVVYEGWSRQQDFVVTPRNIRIDNALGLPTYEVGKITMPRDMKDVWSLRFGVEHTDHKITMRAGFMIENGAFPSRTLTPLTLDSNKAMVSVGGSLEIFNDVYLDGMYAHVFMANMEVRDSVVYPQNPLRPPLQASPGDPVGRPEPVGNGNYVMEADMIGGGLRIKL